MDRVTEFLETEFPDADERALLLGIAASPTDKTAKLVYADWLDDRSDPRGEYVRLLVKNGRKKPTARMVELRKACSGPWLSMMGDLRQAFAAIKKEVEGRDEVASGWQPTVRAKFDRGMWDFHYTGNLWLEEDGLTPVLDFLCDPSVSRVLSGVALNAYGDHPATNGTLHVELEPLTTGKVSFPYLEQFLVEQETTNTILCRDGGYEEGGTVARLLVAFPKLRSLAVPSAPNAEFFRGRSHPLEVLDVRSGYATQQFIRNLAKSERFPNLRVLRHKDFCCEYMDPEPPMFTPFKEWKAFFRSPVCAALEQIELSALVLTEAEVRALLKIRSEGVSIDRSSKAP